MLSRTLWILIALLVVLYGAFILIQRQSDGPLNGMIPGGPLRSGELVPTADIDWTLEFGAAGTCSEADCPEMAPVELQFLDPPLSRYVGIMVHEGVLYVPCDLGYMWGRFEGTQRNILHLIYLFKNWHHRAVEDGRAVIRTGGRRYALQAVRVADPALVSTLKLQLEDMARRWVAPEPLGEPPTEGPRDIWFFRMDPADSGDMR
jgi:hypothetical protein